MELSFATQMKEAGVFDGIVLPGSFDLTLKGRSVSRMRAWCLPWILPELMGHHLDFPATDMCVVSRSQECGLWYNTVAAGTQLSLLLVPGCSVVWRSLPPAVAARQIFQTSWIDPTTGPGVPPFC